MGYLTFQSMEVAVSGLHESALEMDYMFKEGEPQRPSENWHTVVSGGWS